MLQGRTTACGAGRVRTCRRPSRRSLLFGSMLPLSEKMFTWRCGVVVAELSGSQGCTAWDQVTPRAAECSGLTARTRACRLSSHCPGEVAGSGPKPCRLSPLRGSLGDALGCDAGHPPVYVAWDAEVRGLWDGSSTPARVSHSVLTPRASGALSPAVYAGLGLKDRTAQTVDTVFVL